MPRDILQTSPSFYVKQVRKKKRSLHEATARKGRKEPNRLAKRNEKNTKQVLYKNKVYHIYDKVEIDNKVGYLTGFSGSMAYVQNLDGDYITKEGKTYKQVPLNELKVLSHNNNWIYETKVI